ncbi:hypothetical protein ALC56_09397 [Trachymyrmex septentrionalis]|uniref:Uncharacterized protein n=1 Tax=Trachymyrmex septentrionalis TaxID=34720 RepID=A0A195F8C0_9HYME|nr:hypothetical protein ALC56_09397 [Trachymyrmex septentrionalis]
MPTLRRLVDLLRVTENGQQNSARGKETAGYNGTAQHYKVYILLRDNPPSSEAIDDKFQLDSSLQCLTPCCRRHRNSLALENNKTRIHSSQLRITFAAVEQ